MNTHDAIEKVKHLKDYIMVFENIHQVTLMDDSDKEAIDTVVAELEKPTYTAQDMEAFAEWCSENGWSISIKKHRWVNDNGEGINTAQLREMWEQERRETK